LRDGINSQRRRERRFSGFETGQLGKISVFLNNFFLLLDGFEILKCSALSPRGVRTALGQPGEKTSLKSPHSKPELFFLSLVLLRQDAFKSKFEEPVEAVQWVTFLAGLGRPKNW
jgi:hypothetical protein